MIKVTDSKNFKGLVVNREFSDGKNGWYAVDFNPEDMKIQWPSYGSVSIKDAEKFAKLLDMAINTAKKLQ